MTTPDARSPYLVVGGLHGPGRPQKEVTHAPFPSAQALMI